MRGTFLIFPDRLPGVGLLVLRLAAGVALVWYANYIFEWIRPVRLAQIVIVVSITVGLFLMVGYLTRMAGAVVAIGTLASRLAWPHTVNASMTEATLVYSFIGIVAAALLCLGPGAFSVDARRYGRREIVIPRRSGRP